MVEGAGFGMKEKEEGEASDPAHFWEPPGIFR